MSSYTNPTCTPCSTSQTVVVPCDGCSMILSDTCIVRKTDANACLGIDINDTLHTIIDKIAAKLCSITLDWTCLTPPSPSTTSLNVVLQALINNVESNKLTFSSGFTVTPITGGCGSLVTYAGSGLTLTSTAGTITTGSPASSIILTPGSGTYNLQPSFANATRVFVTPLLAGVDNSGGSALTQCSYRVRWDNHVDFDGFLAFDNTILNYLAWNGTSPVFSIDHPSTGVYNLFTLAPSNLPDRPKEFPAKFKISSGTTSPVPASFCGTFDARIIVWHAAGGGKVQLVIDDCRDMATMLEAFQVAFPYPGNAINAVLWFSQVQYYTV